MDISWKQSLIETYKDLHQIPEIGLQEYETTAYIKTFLSKIKEVTIIKPQSQITGVVCLINPENYIEDSTQSYLFRCDIDALPLQEESGVSYQSNNGMHHACGHDAHTAMMLYAVSELAKKSKQIKRRIIFCFQPGQEGHRGAFKLLKAYPDLLKKVKHCFALHIGNFRPKGTLCLSQTYATNNSMRFSIVINGKSAHVMLPHLAIDANRIGSKIIDYIYSIKSSLDPHQSVVIAVTKIEGGKSMISISDYMKLTVSLRTLNLQIHKSILERIKKYCDGLCAAEGATAQISIPELGYRAVKNQKEPIKIVCKCGQKMMDKIQFIPPSAAGEDFCEFSQKVPSCYFALGVGIPEDIDPITKQSLCPLHSSKFRLDESALELGVKMWVELALS